MKILSLLRHNLAARMFVSIFAAFFAVCIFQFIVLDRNIDKFYLRRHRADAGQDLLHTAETFVADGCSNSRAVSGYVQKNESPLVIYDEQGTLYNTDIFNCCNIMTVQTLRGDTLHLLADFLLNYSDHPFDALPFGALLHVSVSRIGNSDYYQLVEIQSPNRVYQMPGFSFGSSSETRLCRFEKFSVFGNDSTLNFRRQLLLDFLLPSFIGSGSRFDDPAPLDGTVIDDAFGNDYALLSHSVPASGHSLTFLTMLPVADSSLLFDYLSEYHIYLYAFFLIVLAMLTCWFSRNLSAPLVHLSKVAERMALLDFSSRAHVRSPDQLGKLSDSLNILSDNLQDAIQALESVNETIDKRFQEENENAARMKILLEDMAHEFKTPLGIISGFTELIEYGLCEQERPYYFHVIKTEIAKLSELVDDTIEISKMNAGYFIPNFQRADIADTILEIVERLQPEMEKNGFSLSLDLTHAVVYIDKKRISQVFYNLFSNIFKYTNGDKNIFLSACMTAPHEITVRTQNSGVLSQNELNNIFDRYRLGADAPDRRVRRSGIGLEIVRRILTLHGSRYGIESENGQICFYFTLPIVSDE